MTQIAQMKKNKKQINSDVFPAEMKDIGEL